jgi:hypothetical protein
MEFDQDDPPTFEKITPELIYAAIDECGARYLNYLDRFEGIPINGKRDAPLWDGGMTPITFALFESHNIIRQGKAERIAEVVRLLYLKCGVPVFGRGAGTFNPLSICIEAENLHAARVLLEVTDAQMNQDYVSQDFLLHIIDHGFTEMLELCSRFKERTFPNSAEYLNQYHRIGTSNTIPLFIAVNANNARMVYLLIYKFGANPYIEDFCEDIPIVESREGPEGDAIRRLLQHREREQSLIMSHHAMLKSRPYVRTLPGDLPLVILHKIMREGSRYDGQ